MSDYVVVLAGGSGTRFWPKSTRLKPKQLLSFNLKQNPKDGIEDSILLNQTLSRFDSWVPKKNQMVVTTQLLKTEIERLVNSGVEVLAEPAGRNTAPCIYWAAQVISARDPKAVMMIMPSDHMIPDLEAFTQTVREASAWAREKGDLVTLGITPSRPETGYGYLRTGVVLEGQCRKVEAFVEKPNLEKALEFVRAGHYLWNGGMFLWRVDAILEEFDHAMPEMKKAWIESGGQVETAYPLLTATSIDYGVMEKSKKVVTFPLDCGWDDLGSWTSLENLAHGSDACRDGSVVINGDLASIDSSGNVIDVPGRLVATLGVNDLIIVESGQALLVADKERAQDIKQMVEKVKSLRPDLV